MAIYRQAGSLMIKCTRCAPMDGGVLSERRMNLKGNTVMDLVKGIKEKRSIRKFQDEPVPRGLLVVEYREKNAKVATEECTLGSTYNFKTMVAAPALVLLTYVTKRWGYEKDGSFTASINRRHACHGKNRMNLFHFCKFGTGVSR